MDSRFQAKFELYRMMLPLANHTVTCESFGQSRGVAVVLFVSGIFGKWALNTSYLL